MKKFYLMAALATLFSCSDQQPEEYQLPGPEPLSAREALVEAEDEPAEEDPQMVEDRIQEIKTLYKEFQGFEGERECKTATTTIYDGFYEDDQFPFENVAKECKTETDFLVKEVTLNGYAWAEHTSFFYKDDMLFFAFTEGGAEACAYEYRVYYSKENEVIRVLAAENDCEGNDIGSSEDVTEGKKRNEVLNSVAYALEQFTSILAQE